MTPTDEMHRLLTEAGVEYRFNDATKVFEWHFDGTDGEGSAHATEVNGGINIIACSLTPEQAIAATLGATDARPMEVESSGTLSASQISNAVYAHSIHADCADADWQAIADELNATLERGTCHPVISDNLTESEGTGDAWADCSECGHLLFVLTDPTSEPPNYCHNCGRRLEVGA